MAYPNFTYDASQTFESALSGEWSESDSPAVVNPQDSSAEYRGTYGMSYASGTTAEAWVVWVPATSKNSLSLGFWYKTGQYASWAGDRNICIPYSGSYGNLIIAREGVSAGDNTRRISFSVSSGAITVSDNTWYWITMKFVKNGTSSLAVYNTSGTQVGSTLTGTAPNSDADYVVFGGYGVSSTTATYFDEIYIDYADATFPLGPPTEDAAAGNPWYYYAMQQ